MKAWTIGAIKEETLYWLRDRFEVPDAEWVEGMPRSTRRCPIAEVLTKAGYEDVWVGRSLIRYTQDQQTIKVRLPLKCSLFTTWFDEGRMPELVFPAFRQFLPEIPCQENNHQGVKGVKSVLVMNG